MRRRIHPFAVLAAGTGLAVVVPSCLQRPLSTAQPETNTNFTSVVTNQAIDKVDILFVLDNSASMGDKTEYLTQAVPNLITRLVQPNCIDTNGKVVGQSDSGGLGNCTTGKVEFPPVHDMHIGLVSSSLGTRLSDLYSNSSAGVAAGSGTICPAAPSSTLPPGVTATQTLPSGTVFSQHNDDRAELLNRTNPTDDINDATGSALSDAGSGHYLNWFPTVPKNQGKTPSPGAPAITSANTLITDFTQLLTGVGNYGCGIESQLESFYRFLIQPDPYADLKLDNNGNALWDGVDSTILLQRSQFLRPDSLVAIIDMTDENDSEIDVRALGGQGYRWMGTSFDPFMGTAACAENSTNSDLVSESACTYCGFQGVSCPQSPNYYSNGNDWGYNPNLRHVHMQQKYGVWPQFPIQRYQIGLTSTKVPDRFHEYPSGASSYQGLNPNNFNCTNPLFAASLPNGSKTDTNTLCNLPVGSRPASLVYFAHIGGVPHQLLQGTAGDGTCPAGTPTGQCPPKATLLNADWVKILGKGKTASPINEYDFTGIDPHMVEAYAPRTGVPATGAAAGPSQTNPGQGLDAFGVTDWVTNTGTGHILEVDREYACTFELATPRDCSNTKDPTVSFACDCPSTATLTGNQIPPLCDSVQGDTGYQTSQLRAKTYPTVRELELAFLMQQQGIVSSLCPIDVTPASGQTELTDPLYGYNPAVSAIIDRLKVSLNNQCLPDQLTADSLGNVPCLILVQLGTSVGAGACANPGSACDPNQGLLGPGAIPNGATNAPLTQDILTKFCAAQHAQYTGDGGPNDPDTHPTCALQQLLPLTASGQPNTADFPSGAAAGCASSKDNGWCYVTGPAANGCPQAILFSNGEPPSGATVSLQCIKQASGSSSSSSSDASAAGD
jgi:hypothetical protein